MLRLGQYEHKSQPLLPRARFYRRLWRHFLASTAIVAISLFVGMAGYHALAGFGWIDSFLNASMLLGGMGPVGEITTDSGKIFAALYALWSGLVIIATMGLLLAPVLHRIMHRVHLEGSGKD